MAARVAHNHEVPGSSPGPATKIRIRLKRRVFILVCGLIRTGDARGPCENCLRQFGNESSDENLFSIVKFGGRGT